MWAERWVVLAGRTAAARDSACCGERLQTRGGLSPRFEAAKNTRLQSRDGGVSRHKTPANTTVTAGYIPGLLRLRLIFSMTRRLKL